MTPILELRGITKRFPGVLANDHIDLTLEQGEIHALLGENGAGKTTLMNILYGLYQPDEGSILVRDQPLDVHSPSDAIAAGIGMVHQHFMLIPVFTVTENVMLGMERLLNAFTRGHLLSFTGIAGGVLALLHLAYLALSSGGESAGSLFVAWMRNTVIVFAVLAAVRYGLLRFGGRSRDGATSKRLKAFLEKARVETAGPWLLLGIASLLTLAAGLLRVLFSPNGLLVLKLWLPGALVAILGSAVGYASLYLLVLARRRGTAWFILTSLLSRGVVILLFSVLAQGWQASLAGSDMHAGLLIGGTLLPALGLFQVVDLIVRRAFTPSIGFFPADWWPAQGPGLSLSLPTILVGAIIFMVGLAFDYAVAELAVGLLDRRKASEEVNASAGQHALAVHPYGYVEDLPVGVQQRVEIIKLLYRQADILIFDEPTAVLTPQEADGLFKIMRALVAQGKSIIFITHKLREVLEVADRITVLRRGAVVGTTRPAEADRTRLAAMMVGREVQLEVEKKVVQAGEVVLAVRDLVVTDERRQVAVDGVSFEVCTGEVFGVAGVQGNGQTELVEAVTGLRRALSGSIQVLGNETTGATPRHITELGTAHVPEDRQRDGLVLPSPVTDNLVLCTYYQPPFARGRVLQEGTILTRSGELIEQFDIRTPSPLVAVGSLSGGNQQKVIVAREFSRPIRLLVASQPTRGLDVGSIEYIHKRIIEKRDAGCAVLLVSPELDEVLELSDRIAVMYRGKIVAVIPAEKATKEYLGLLMAGVSVEQAGEPTGKRTVEVTL